MLGPDCDRLVISPDRNIFFQDGTENRTKRSNYQQEIAVI